MLASDDNNPDFVNPKDPDSMLHVEFYDFEAPDKWLREVGDAQGVRHPKAVKPACPYVRISIPGNKDLTIETPAAPEHLKRFPRQWLHYQMQTGKIANAENVPGWQIDDWDELNAEQIRQLKFIRFFTVEQIAGASDAQIQGIGMGGAGLRTRAQDALKAKNGKVVSEAIAERDAKINGLEEKLSKLMDLVTQLTEKSAEPAAEPAAEKLDFEPQKRGPGRPSTKAQEAA